MILSPVSFQSAAPPPPITESAGGKATSPGKGVPAGSAALLAAATLPGSGAVSAQAKLAPKLNSNLTVDQKTPDAQHDAPSDFIGALQAATGKQDAEPEPQEKKQEPKDSSTSNQNATVPTQVQGRSADSKPFLLAQLGFGFPAPQKTNAETSSSEAPSNKATEVQTDGKTGSGTLPKSTDRVSKVTVTPGSKQSETMAAPAPLVPPLTFVTPQSFVPAPAPPTTSVNSDDGEKSGTAGATTASVEPGSSPEPLELHGAEVQSADKAKKDPAVAEKPAGSLAFAMRITADEATDESRAIAPVSGGTSLGQSGSHNSGAGFSLPELKAGSDHPSSSSDGTNQNFQSVYSQAAPHSMNADAPATEKSAAATTQTELDAPLQSPANQPLKNLNVQLTGENNQRVDVRLSDRGGALQVSVRSADLNLNQALQDKMPELTSRLEAQHMNAQVWTPSLEQSAKSDANANGSASQGQNPDDHQSGNQHGYQGNGQKNQKQPDWLDELD